MSLSRPIETTFGPEHCAVECAKLFKNMTLDSNIEILSFENANIRRGSLVEEAIGRMQWLLSLDISYNQIHECEMNIN